MIPSDEQINAFCKKLEEQGCDEVEKKLSQGIYAKNTWKHKQVLRFIEKCKEQDQHNYKNEQSTEVKKGNDLRKQGNKIAFASVIVSVIVLIISIAAFLK